MEPDRYEESHAYFIAGIIGLVGALIFFAWGFFIFPHLILGWRYQMPDFIIWVHNLLQEEYHWSAWSASWLIELFFLCCGGIFAMIAYLASNHIENRIYHSDQNLLKSEETSRKGRTLSEAILLTLKLIFILLLIYVISLLFHWAMSAGAKA